MAYLGSKPSSNFITTAKQRVTSSTNNYVDLDHAISTLADVIVWVNYVKQDATNLSLTTSTRITLGGTLTSSDVVEIAYLGKAVATQTPSNNSVTNNMLAGSIDLTSKVTGALPQANIADQAINEAKLQISNAPTNGYFLSAQSGNTGGLTWAEAGGVCGTNRFSARRSGNQSSISSDTFTKINITTELEDPDGVYDASNSKFIAPAAGTYFFTAKTYCWGNIQKISGSFAVNGSATSTAGYNSHVILDGDFSNSGHQFTAHSTHIYVLSQNDYVEFWVKATLHSGSMVSDEVGTHFAGFRIA